ncbi:MAG: hypothetical protein ACKO6N_26925 [Myxococcota bacterium]
MSEHSLQNRLAGRLRQQLATSLGVQVLLLDAARTTLARVALQLSGESLSTPLDGTREGTQDGTREGTREGEPRLGLETPTISHPAATVAVPSSSSLSSAAPVGSVAAGAAPVEAASLLAPPYTAEAVRTVIQLLRDTVSALDDVKDYDLIKDIDEDMYQLWKELERKMQRHRQSEARFQLKDMFRI